ncbi:MAG: aldehyde dehydrogenase (NADP(+)) [Bacteroidota bacterium]
MKISGKNIIGFKKSGKGRRTFTGITANAVADAPAFKIAAPSEVNTAMQKAQEAFQTYRHFTGSHKAKFLRAIAEEIEHLGDQLIDAAMTEAGLPEGRVRGERGRTMGQLRLFADHVEEGSWVNAIIETAIPERKPFPKADIRTMYQPMGPVVVFTASNFPLAFSTAGGDTASALASGCPVVVKGHEAHPVTNELVSSAIQKAAKKTGMPDGVFSMLNGDYKTGGALVKHELTAAVAFTGSLQGGRALFDIANKRSNPIPVFAEMGSVNPVIILQGARDQWGNEIAKTLAGSVALGAGQFCTNPGLVFVPENGHEAFADALASAMQAANGQCMLNNNIFNNYFKRLEHALAQNGVKAIQLSKGSKSENVLPSAGIAAAETFLANPELREEVFGPFTLLVTYQNGEELVRLIKAMNGQLTATVYGEKHELGHQLNLINELNQIAGRLIINGVPTGVEVCHAMQHGGPYPASTDGRFTSVGTEAIKRFVRPVCYQNFPIELLPAALQDRNPLGIWRKVNGEFVQS